MQEEYYTKLDTYNNMHMSHDHLHRNGKQEHSNFGGSDIHINRLVAGYTV